MARVPYSGGHQREREEKGVKLRPGGTQSTNKALAQGLHLTKALGVPEGNLSPGRKVSSADVHPPRLRENGKQREEGRVKEGETSASPLPSFGTKNVTYSSVRGRKRTDHLNRSRLPLFK